MSAFNASTNGGFTFGMRYIKGGNSDGGPDYFFTASGSSGSFFRLGAIVAERISIEYKNPDGTMAIDYIPVNGAGGWTWDWSGKNIIIRVSGTTMTIFNDNTYGGLVQASVTISAALANLMIDSITIGKMNFMGSNVGYSAIYLYDTPMSGDKTAGQIKTLYDALSAGSGFPSGEFFGVANPSSSTRSGNIVSAWDELSQATSANQPEYDSNGWIYFSGTKTMTATSFTSGGAPAPAPAPSPAPAPAPAPSGPQDPTIAWRIQNAISTSGQDGVENNGFPNFWALGVARTIGADSSGNVYGVYYTSGVATGETSSGGGGDLAIYKVNSAGTVVWVKQNVVSTSAYNYLPGATVDSTGNLICGSIIDNAGASVSGSGNMNSGANDISIYKISPSGSLIWAKQTSNFNTSAQDFYPSYTTDSSDNVYLAHEAEASGKIRISKHSSDGTFQWATSLTDTTFNTTSTNFKPCIITGSSGSVYVAYHTNGRLSGVTSLDSGSKIVVAKLNSSGVCQWAKQTSFNATGNCSWPRICVDSSENIYGVYHTDGALSGSSNSGSNDIIVFKLDSAGNTLWTVKPTNINTTLNDRFGDIVYNVAYNKLFIAYNTNGTVTGGTSAGDTDVVLARIDPSTGATESIQQSTSINSAFEDIRPSLVTNSMGDMFIAYQTSGGGAGGYDAVILKLSPQGVTIPSSSPTTANEALAVGTTGSTGALQTYISASASTSVALAKEVRAAIKALTDATAKAAAKVDYIAAMRAKEPTLKIAVPQTDFSSYIATFSNVPTAISAAAKPIDVILPSASNIVDITTASVDETKYTSIEMPVNTTITVQDNGTTVGTLTYDGSVYTDGNGATYSVGDSIIFGTKKVTILGQGSALVEITNTYKSIEVNLNVEISANGTIEVLGYQPAAPSNIVIAATPLPVDALYDSSNNIALIEFWEPDNLDDIMAQLASTQTLGGVEGYRITAKKLALGLQNCLIGELDAKLAEPFNAAPKYGAAGAQNGNRVMTGFGRFALMAYAHYIMGHVQATAAITNDTDFMKGMLSLNSDTLTDYKYASVGNYDDAVAPWSTVGTATDANLAVRLVKALIDNNPTTSLVSNGAATTVANIVKQVVGQDASRATDEDNNKYSPENHGLLRFYPDDVIYVSINLTTPTVTVGTGQQVSGPTMEGLYENATGDKKYTLKLTIGPAA